MNGELKKYVRPKNTWVPYFLLQKVGFSCKLQIKRLGSVISAGTLGTFLPNFIIISPQSHVKRVDCELCRCFFSYFGFNSPA
jgi:hypothetical protein